MLDDTTAAWPIKVRIEVGIGQEEGETCVYVTLEVHLEDINQWPGPEEEISEFTEREGSF